MPLHQALGTAMGAGIPQRQASSVAQVLEYVRAIARQWSPRICDPQELWFRGQSKANYRLVPGLYRAANARFHYDEQTLFERFRVRGEPFVTPSIKNDWDWYFLAQHHSLITRLLDWTTNLIAAIYFALCSQMEAGDRSKYDSDMQLGQKAPIFDDECPVVWMLDAGSLNAFSCRDTQQDYVFVPGGELSAKYLPEAISQNKSSDNEFPLAILPSQRNNRIAAQQAVFTVHGHNPAAIEELASRVSDHEIQLAKIVLDRGNLHMLWSDLEVAGINRASLFPGLESVAYCVKWIGQYLGDEPSDKEDGYVPSEQEG